MSTPLPAPRWRPIKTAPKDTDVLLCHPGGDGETMYVNQGRWVDVEHTHFIERQLRDGNQSPTWQRTDGGQWMIGYVAILETGGAHTYRSYEARTWIVWPTHWMPLPAPRKGRSR